MILSLVKIGVPYDVATAMSPERKLAFIVANGEIEGGEFDWSQRRWLEK